MKLFTFTIFPAFLAYACAAPTEDLEKRQAPPGRSNTWNDPYIPQPRNFQIRPAVGTCSYQLSFERFAIDSRYEYTFDAIYANGSERRIDPATGGLSYSRCGFTGTTNSPFGRYALGDTNNDGDPDDLAVFRFADANLVGSFTYRNPYSTPPLAIGTAALPAAPQGVRATRQGRSTTVTWQGVSGATGYFVMVAYDVDSEAGPLPAIRTVRVGAGLTSAKVPVGNTYTAVVSARKGAGEVSSVNLVPDVAVAAA